MSNGPEKNELEQQINVNTRRISKLEANEKVADALVDEKLPYILHVIRLIVKPGTRLNQDLIESIAAIRNALLNGNKVAIDTLINLIPEK